MTKLSYRGTPEQALALVNIIHTKFADAKRKSKHTSLEDAMNDLVDDISNLQNLVTNGTKSSLLDACFEFAYIEEQLTIVRLLVEKQRTGFDD